MENDGCELKEFENRCHYHKKHPQTMTNPSSLPKWALETRDCSDNGNECYCYPRIDQLKEALSIAWAALENHGHARPDDCIYHEAMRQIAALGEKE